MESPSEPVALVDDEQVSGTTVELEQMPSTAEIDEDGALQKRDKDALQEVNGNDKNSPKKVLDSRKPEYLQFGTLALQKALDAQRSRKHEQLQFGARCCKFSEANPKSDVEWAAYRGKQCPGPGEYTIKRDLTTSGGRFNMSNPKSDRDWIIYTHKKQPGPGQYRITEDPVIGGKFALARPRTSLEWTIFNARDKPGPGQYNPDAYYKVNGGRFSDVKIKPDVEWGIERVKVITGSEEHSMCKKDPRIQRSQEGDLHKQSAATSMAEELQKQIDFVLIESLAESERLRALRASFVASSSSSFLSRPVAREEQFSSFDSSLVASSSSSSSS